MKKIFLFAALAGIVFASCQKEAPVASVAQNEGQQEVTFAAFSKAMTRGVLGSGTFAEDRTIKVAGVMKTTDGQYVDFLEVTDFTKQGDYWKAANVYYPIGGSGDAFRFLAYSESSGDATFARWYGSKEVELQVADCAKNEIVYSGFWGNKNGAANAAFHRTQALVTVYIHPASGDAEKITINKIGFKDVKTSGTLVLTIDPKNAASADAKHKWIYTAGCNCALAEMGNYNLGETVSGDASGDASVWVPNAETITANAETEFRDVAETASGDCLKKPLAAGFILDRLFPAQEVEAATMIINYTLGSITTDVALDLSKAIPTDSEKIKWQAGTRYVYNIKVKVGEILINPQSLEAWTLTTISGTYDPE